MSIYVGDIGTQISIDVGEDISNASTATIYYRKPNRATGSWAATLATTSASYTTISGDVDMPGNWTLQLYLALPSWSGHSTPVSIDVSQPLA